MFPPRGVHPSSAPLAAAAAAAADHAKKMSSAVDGLLSLRGGERPGGPPTGYPGPPRPRVPGPPGFTNAAAAAAAAAAAVNAHNVRSAAAAAAAAAAVSAANNGGPVASVANRPSGPLGSNGPFGGQRRSPINMERLWAGDKSQLPANSTDALSGSNRDGVGSSSLGGGNGGPIEEDEEPLICMICEDKATGLHYGIITCEG